MNDARELGLFDKHSGAFTYALVCLGGLACVLLGLFQRGVGVWGLLPVILSLVGMLLRWRSGPVLVLLTVVWLLLARSLGLDPFSYVLSLLNEGLHGLFFEPLGMGRGPTDFFSRGYALPNYFVFRLSSDPFLCVGLLMHTAGAFRLQSITWSVFPIDSRRREPKSPQVRGPVRFVDRPVVKPRRTASLVNPREITALLITSAACTGAATLAWFWLRAQGDKLTGTEALSHLEPSTWRAIIIVWLFGIGLIVVAGILSYFGQGSAPPEEAQMLLQDVMWRETVREQRSLTSWLAWARLRRKKREVEP
jgi:hypothetical protein